MTVWTVNGEEKFVAYKEWDALLQANFEKCFYIPTGKSFGIIF